MKYTIGDLIHGTNRVGLIIKAEPNNYGYYWYKVEWQLYFDSRIRYTNDLNEEEIDRLFLLPKMYKYLQVIK